jgi:hypothetical protein
MGDETMNATTVETDDRPVNVEEQVRNVSALLKEYAEKLSALNANLINTVSNFDRTQARLAAWFLDQGELLRQPLSRIISRGSGLLEHSNLDPLTKDELAVRMREIDIHFHHMLRLTHELKQTTENARLKEAVDKLRYAAGLNAMKGGPLHPE